MKITVLRCLCGKMHTVSGLTSTSICACGRSLWSQLGNAR